MLTRNSLIQSKKQSGFTIVELLIVIVVIGILAALALATFSGVQQRARDTKRAEALASIKKVLQAYEAVHGGVKSTVGSGSYTGGINYSGWDASTSPNWLAFLRTEHGIMPVDPKNTMTATNNPPAAGNFNYFYYCYNAGSGPLPATSNVRIGYHKDDNTLVVKDFAVAACLP